MHHAFADLTTLRHRIRDAYLTDETAAVRAAVDTAGLNAAARADIALRATALVEDVRATSRPHFTERFLADFGLSTDEGLALMCLAEALLRVPDAETVDTLIKDKITHADWASLAGRSPSVLVNASTWALALTGKILADDEADKAQTILGLTRRIGEVAVRSAVLAAMRELGRQFVHGRTIDEALQRSVTGRAKGRTYSYDMLGEAAHTHADADRYFKAYADAIAGIAAVCDGKDTRRNPGISVKLSALHPRYDALQCATMMPVLLARTKTLARAARDAGIGFNIDAEEAERLDVSLDVVEALVADPQFMGWDGLGVVVQAYGKRAPLVLDWLYGVAAKHDRRLMVRLVKGAYWDSEIKRAQVLGIADYPVYTRKPHSDIAYIACARKLMGYAQRLYPQFATHNAHTMTAVLRLAEDAGLTPDDFEFQRLHGMGEALHDRVMASQGTRLRIYAPVGKHRDLLAYLVRRLLENGANSSFVNQMTDERVPAAEIAADPFAIAAETGFARNGAIALPSNLFPSGRVNAKGYDVHDPVTRERLLSKRAKYMNRDWQAAPIIDGDVVGTPPRPVYAPQDPSKRVGYVRDSAPEDIATALRAAGRGHALWQSESTKVRADILRRVADAYEENTPAFCALLAMEAGKTIADCIAEIREAVDFLRYYADEAERRGDVKARGVFTCISPWNFPLAIFTGQIAAALAVGNAVIAKPAETTSLIAAFAVPMFHAAGVPVAALQVLLGTGADVGGPLTGTPDIDGVCFTGSTATAQRINVSMAGDGRPKAPLIAETGGLNAMIVDSTALPEQVVRDIVTSAFQSAGQRCSALRLVYVQDDIYAPLTEMLFGAMDALVVGDPLDPATDVGPVIDAAAKSKIDAYVADNEGRVLKRIAAPEVGTFVAPVCIAVSGMADLAEEVFGPVLHIARYRAGELDTVIDAVNASGYGLTFGVHSRIESRTRAVAAKVRAGNIYVNRNQIGAIVESQPFGGEGLSGTGPKAGGPNYLDRFRSGAERASAMIAGTAVDAGTLQSVIDGVARPERIGRASARVLPGPTGEENLLLEHPRGLVLCLGPSVDDARAQAETALGYGCSAVVACPEAEALGNLGERFGARVGLVSGSVAPAALANVSGISAVALWAADDAVRPYRIALAGRDGALVPLIAEAGPSPVYISEQCICTDTTAAGGNASLLAAASD